MKTLFIQNNGIQESIGIANLSGILKANGHDTDLLLVSHTSDLIGAIKKYDPGLIAFSALTGVHHSIEKLAVTIKRQLNIPIIVGGPHPTYSPEMIFGDGHRHHLPGRRRARDARARRRDGARSRRHEHPQPSRQDAQRHGAQERPASCRAARRAAVPDRELYYKYAFLRDMPMKRFISSMGCPYPCTFCHEPVIRDLYKKSTQVRVRAAEVRARAPLPRSSTSRTAIR